MSSESVERISIDCCRTTTVHTLMGQRHDPGAPGLPRPRPQPRRRLRFMQPDGTFHGVFQKGPSDWSAYLMDIYTTLVEMRWRVTLLLFSLSYILSWLLFALLYWGMAYAHGDLAPPRDNPPCVENVRSFTAAFLFSLETQATIGYGFRGMTENCVAAVVVVTVHSLLSCAVDTVVIGVVVAKMASPRKRAQTVSFSRCAVVNVRDGVLCLSWRLGDFRGNHIVEGVARAQVVRCVTAPSGAVHVSYRDLELQDRDVVLAAPATVVHRLSPGSPLYGWGPEDDGGDDRRGTGKAKGELTEEEEEDFELIVSFTYTGDTTGMLHQTRASYASSDIRWGQRFVDVLTLGRRRYKVDYALFNQTTWVGVPQTLSAREENSGSQDPPGVPQTLSAREENSGSQDPPGVPQTLSAREENSGSQDPPGVPQTLSAREENSGSQDPPWESGNRLRALEYRTGFEPTERVMQEARL